MKYVGQVLTSSLLWTEKHDVILLNVFNEIPKNEAGHFDGVLDFYFCGDIPSADDPAPPEKLLDWKKDALQMCIRDRAGGGKPAAAGIHQRSGTRAAGKAAGNSDRKE